MQHLRRTLEVLLFVYVIGLVGLGVAAAVAPVAGYGLYAVRSASMTPALGVGDLAIEARVGGPVSAAAIRPGDVVSFTTGTGATVTHRVATVTPNDDGPVFTTKGDANATPDPVATPARQVHGVVVADVPILGYLLAFLTTPSGCLSLLSMGLSLLVVLWLLDEAEVPRRARPAALLPRFGPSEGAPT